MSPTYHLRPGTSSDIQAAAELYVQSFAKEELLDYMFPGRDVDPTPFDTWALRRFRIRYWTPGYILTMLDAHHEDGHDETRSVGFTWWHRPTESLSFRQRWLSPYAWFAPVVRSLLDLHSYIFPVHSVDQHRVAIYDRVFATIEPTILNSPRRCSAWYLSSLGVSPNAQGRGLGSLLLQDGLREADREGVCTWLVGLRGLDTFYSRFGYVEVARANVGELKDWDGGVIMFRGE
ncbi:hypothetical protein FZEAL_6593 [Fusarium zealandicum]|uniref:N-acetyltransferase domain-containing protein n=1 Tax=Fusarium zealandicum TaxID=1053134 RepID=A0A8H4UI09_9HYPO|nr:hypothetical protein FZEAL_6593 [Fusarium zealandicum]